MKNIIYIILVSVVAVSTACTDKSRDSYDLDPETSGLMSVTVKESEASSEKDDKIETVRFLVFKNASTSPQLELNERFDVLPDSPGEEVTKFEIMLEVSRKLVNDKMIVVIANEPAEMKSRLDAVTIYSTLAEEKLSLEHFLEEEHTVLKGSKTMPMTGVTWTNKVYATQTEAEADPAQMEIHRAVARVDVLIKKETDLTFKLAAGTELTLENTYDQEYLFWHKESGHEFGKIQTVSAPDFKDKTWTWSNVSLTALPDSGDGSLLCTFYTPERTCTTDKLKLQIKVVTDEGATRTGTLVFDNFKLEGADKNIDNILRNNKYRVLITVGAESLTAEVLDWNDEDFEIIF